MNHPQFDIRTTAPAPAAGRWPADWARPPTAPVHTSVRDGAFIALQNAYRPHAGLLRLRSRAAGQSTRCEAPECDAVAELVDAGALFGFPWHDALWIPLFQLHRPGTVVATGPQRVVAELGRGFDGWALASWFVQTNSWLAGDRPIDCLASRLPEVLEAARADRFVVLG